MEQQCAKHRIVLHALHIRLENVVIIISLYNKKLLTLNTTNKFLDFATAIHAFHPRNVYHLNRPNTSVAFIYCRTYYCINLKKLQFLIYGNNYKYKI